MHKLLFNEEVAVALLHVLDVHHIHLGHSFPRRVTTNKFHVPMQANAHTILGGGVLVELGMVILIFYIRVIFFLFVEFSYFFSR